MRSSAQILHESCRIVSSRETFHATESDEIRIYCRFVLFVSVEFFRKRTSMVGPSWRIPGASNARGLGNRPHGGGSDHSRPQILLGGRIHPYRSAFQPFCSSHDFSLDISHLESGLHPGFCSLDGCLEDRMETRLVRWPFLTSHIVGLD